MARINIEDHFWTEVAEVASIVGDYDKTIGNVIRFWRLSQERFKQGRVITEKEFLERGFLKELVPIFAMKVDGGYLAKGSEKHFKWLKERVINGSVGGSRHKNVNSMKSSSYEQANGSKPKQTQASYSYSSSFSEELKTRESSAMTHLPQLALIWNKYRGKLPEVKSCNGQRKRFANLRWKENPDEKHWEAVILRLLASDFCTGKNNRGWVANFDFFIRPETQNKVLEGQYDNKGPAKKETNWDFIFGRDSSDT